MRTLTASFLLLFVFTISSNAQDVRINEVSPEGDWIELYNQSTGSVDVSLWWLCAQFAYTRIDDGSVINGGPPISVISGTLNIPSGGYLVLSWDIDATGSDIDLYNSSDFGSSTAMEDFMQYNFTGGRQGVAETKGIWTVGESTALPAAGKTVSYFGPGTGASAWDVSESTQAADNAVLPVDLVSFDAILMDGDVNLNWTTASEINNLGFEVQMQRQNDPAFNTVAFVNAGGEGSGIQNYSYSIDGVYPGKHLFRLRQVDIGGRKKYSDIVELSVDVNGSFDLTQAYPNPFNRYAEFTVAVARDQQVRVELIDMNGRIARNLHSGVMNSGESYRLKISSEGLSSGTYLYRAVGENFVATRSVVVVNDQIDSSALICR